MTDTPKVQRPLSPHLQVYRLPVTALASISHRGSAVLLSLGLFLVTAWLVAAATSEQAFNLFMGYASHPLGLLLLFGWSAALFYHMCSGTRHLLMDVGFLLKENTINKGVAGVVLGAAILTFGTWYCAYEYHGVGQDLLNDLLTQQEGTDDV